jgi:hypothetical protein
LGGQLIERHTDELDEHNLDHGTKATGCRAYGGAHETHLRDRRVDDPIGTELLQKAVRAFERAPRDSDIFAEEDYRLVFGKRIVKRLENGLPHTKISQENLLGD